MPAPIERDLPEGMTLLDRYTIIDRVGAGGMATIYRATDERLDRVVCVKLLSLVIEGSGGAGGEVYQASYAGFLKEALALSKLQHPNTLRIYDFGYLDAEGGRPFQISEFLDGGNLEQHVRARGALPKHEALAVLERVCGAVSEAHGHQIIHRDIKPSNILFSRVGGVLMPKLADFGIAQTNLRKRTRDGEEEDTEIVGTIPLFSPRWAAPEQLAGGPEGPTTDVYAIGLITAFMLAGRAPFDIEDVRRTFADRVRGDSFLVSRLMDLGIGGDVADVLLASMRASPRLRIQTPHDFFDALNTALGGTRASLPPPVAPPEPRPTHTSITLEALQVDEGRGVTPAETVVDVGGRRVRIVEVHEKIDVTEPSSDGFGARFRVTLLPGRAQTFRLHLKGLNCFVARAGTAPSPALVADSDGAADLVSMQREKIGHMRWSFGRVAPEGRVFQLDDRELVIPPPQGTHAVALEVGKDREAIVICRRG